MPQDRKWPDIILGEEKQPEYVHPENTKLLLDLTQAALQSQIEGVRQMFSRLGTVLTQTSTLASASVGAVCWLVTHPVTDRPGWLTWVFALAALFWSLSGALAIIGMMGAKFGAPGIDPSDGYKQDVLSQSVRDMQLWTIKSYASTLDEGSKASNSLKFYLNGAITILVATPIFCLLYIVANLFL